MASTDARPIPLKGVAYRATFPILDETGSPVAGAAGLDSEVSKDGATFADCTNEATQIAVASGVYVLDLTTTEMNADTVAVLVKTTTSGAKSTVLVFYPQEAGDIPVNVTHWANAAVAPPTVTGVPEVDLTHLRGVTPTATFDTIHAEAVAIQADTNDLQTRLPATLIGGRIEADVHAINGSTQAADNFDRSARTIVLGTVGSGSTITSVVVASFDPGPTVANQFTWRFLIFARDTTTPALRCQATDITAMTTTTLTVSPLAAAPVAGDVFIIT